MIGLESPRFGPPVRLPQRHHAVVNRALAMLAGQEAHQAVADRADAPAGREPDLRHQEQDAGEAGLGGDWPSWPGRPSHLVLQSHWIAGQRSHLPLNLSGQTYRRAWCRPCVAASIE